MDRRYRAVTALAAAQHAAVSLTQLDQFDIDRAVRSRWVRRGLLQRIGPRSFAIAGSAPTWQRALWAASLDLDGLGFIAGRAGSRLYGLDGFRGDAVELLVPRKHRKRASSGVVVSTSRPLDRGDVVRIDGLPVLRADRLILDSPLFAFTREETENAIDSAIRLRLVSEARLRAQVIERHSQGVNGGRQLLDALVDTGGESRLERWFLRLVREACLPRPVLQRVFRSDGRLIARVDAFFPGGLVVEVTGHGCHATRRQRQLDEQRRTELTIRGHRVITFTYDDVRDRPWWVVDRLRDALRSVA